MKGGSHNAYWTKEEEGMKNQHCWKETRKAKRRKEKKNRGRNREERDRSGER